MKKTFFAAACTAVLLSVSAVSVAGATSTVATEPSVPSISPITDWKQIALPLDSYVASVADRNAVLQAEYILTKTCMQGFGLKFNAPAWGKSSAATPQNSHYRLYGLIDAQHAATLGYHATSTIPVAEQKYSEQVFPAAYSNVLAAKDGGGSYSGKPIPEGGCIGDARRSVMDTSANSDQLVESLSYDSWDQSNSDSRVTAAFARWSDCMNSSGFHYSTPMDANNDPKWATSNPSAAEIAVARADVRCKQSTNLTGVRMAVDTAYQNHVMLVNSHALGSLRLAQQAELRSARIALQR